MTEMNQQPSDPGNTGTPSPPGFSASPREDRWTGPMSSDEKTMGLLAHLLGIFTCFIGPLIIWLIKKDTSPYVDAQGKESLNFQLSILIYCFVTCGLAGIFGLIMAIIASIKANEGIVYRYPLAIRFIK
jgi:uncharacterized Tic20 family protein